MTNDLRITLVQQNMVWENVTANLEATRKQTAGIEATDLIVLPEMFTTGFSMYPEKLAEPTEGKALHLMQQLAASKEAAVTGSFIARESGRFYNRLLWVFPDGSWHSYDKRHLFRMSEENKHYTPGDAKLIVQYKGWRILPLICYDLRFPVWSRNDSGYDMLIYVANWPAARSHVWKTLLAARALENQAYVAGVNRVGKDGNGIPFNGDSRLIDPKGRVMTDMPAEENAVQTVTASLKSLQQFRKKFPVDKDRDAFAIFNAQTFYANDYSGNT